MAHVIVAWEIMAEEQLQKTNLRTELRDQLKGYSWIRALLTCT